MNLVWVVILTCPSSLPVEVFDVIAGDLTKFASIYPTVPPLLASPAKFSQEGAPGLPLNGVVQGTWCVGTATVGEGKYTMMAVLWETCQHNSIYLWQLAPTGYIIFTGLNEL